jgi:hypothetical protein
MITVCAWCQRLIAADAPDRLAISHGMCGSCQAASAHEPNLPVLVVPARHAKQVPALERLLAETGIPVVLDRRVAQRRRAEGGLPGEERRQRPDRRANPPAMLC